MLSLVTILPSGSLVDDVCPCSHDFVHPHMTVSSSPAGIGKLTQMIIKGPAHVEGTDDKSISSYFWYSHGGLVSKSIRPQPAACLPDMVLRFPWHTVGGAGCRRQCRSMPSKSLPGLLSTFYAAPCFVAANAASIWRPKSGAVRSALNGISMSSQSEFVFRKKEISCTPTEIPAKILSLFG